MKRSIITTIAVLLLIVFYSCNNAKIDNSANLERIKTLDTIVSLSGYWLSEDYINNLNENKSPKNAQEKGCEYIEIPERTLITTSIILNFHDGGEQLQVLKNKEVYQLWKIDNDSISELMSDIEVVSNAKIKIADKSFIKISPLKIDGETKILEEILFKGQYITTEGKLINFKNNGQISGLDNYNFYSPIIDYSDAGLQIDQIGFGKTTKDFEYFGFKFNKETLELYKLKCITYDSIENECVEVDYGELAYKLLKKR